MGNLLIYSAGIATTPTAGGQRLWPLVPRVGADAEVAGMRPAEDAPTTLWSALSLALRGECQLDQGHSCLGTRARV